MNTIDQKSHLFEVMGFGKDGVYADLSIEGFDRSKHEENKKPLVKKHMRCELAHHEYVERTAGSRN